MSSIEKGNTVMLGVYQERFQRYDEILPFLLLCIFTTDLIDPWDIFISLLMTGGQGHHWFKDSLADHTGRTG